MSSSRVLERPSLSTHIRRFGQDWAPPSATTAMTPFSAVGRPLSRQSTPPKLTPFQVSSFNLPAQYDASLITPVSTTRSPFAMSRGSRQRDRDMKLSPTVLSPDYLTYSGDDDFKSQSPSKTKTPMSAPSTRASSSYPNSPLVCRSPYWGSFGVSAPATSTSRRSASPPAPDESPITSAGAFSTDCRASRQVTPLPPLTTTSYHLAPVQAPILIAPNPSSLRAASRSSADSDYRHDSIASIVSTATASSQATNPRDYELDDASVSSPPRRKRKTPPHQPGVAEMSSEISHEDQILIQLSEKESLQWKEIAQRFNEMTGKNMKVPALQMRKKRLREKLRVFTGSEVCRWICYPLIVLTC